MWPYGAGPIKKHLVVEGEEGGSIMWYHNYSYPYSIELYTSYPYSIELLAMHAVLNY